LQMNTACFAGGKDAGFGSYMHMRISFAIHQEGPSIECHSLRFQI
jgi:hypothetical protein